MTTAVNSDFHDVKSNFHAMITVVYQLPTVNLVQPNTTLPHFLITIQHTMCRLCAGGLSLAPGSPSYFLCWIFSCGLAVCVKQTRAPARRLVCANHWSLSKMILVPTDQRSFSRLFVVTCLHRSMVSFPPTHPTCLYKPIVSYSSPLLVCLVLWSLTLTLPH